MIKKVLALMMLTVMLLTLFSACKKNNADNNSSNELEINTADISFVDADGIATYNIVRPENGTMGETAVAAKVFKKYKEVFSANPKNTSDEVADEGGFEILVGETNRPESAQVKQQLVDNNSKAASYTICSIGNKIVIMGMSKAALESAVTYFMDNYLTGSVVEGGINYTYVDEGSYNVITIGGETNLGLYTIVYPRYNMSYVTKIEIDRLVDSFVTATGFAVDTTTDFTVGDGEVEKVQTTVSDTEIIVDNCMRDGVNQITDADKYEIRFVGKKVYLNGGSPKATAMAVAEFGKLLAAGSADFTDGSSIVGSYKAVEANYSNVDNYKLTWNDDFDKAKIDTSKWEVDYKDATIGGAKGLNGKATHRSTEKSTFVKDDKLYILALQDAHNYYGGMLWTPRSMKFLYGYLELSSLHPKGEGFWTALWANSQNDVSGLYYQETNVEECYGEGTYVKGNIFAWPSDYCKQEFGGTTEHKGTTHYAKTGRGFYMDFHTFGFEWKEGEAQFYCDGEIYGYQDTTKTPAFRAAYSTPAFLKLSMATGFTSNPLKKITDNPEDWNNTNAYIIEYVHVYQKAGQKLYIY